MTRALITLNTQADIDRAIRWIHGIPKGSRIEFKAPSRTLDQNALLWAKLDEISKQVEWYGEKLSKEDWKEIFCASLRKARVVPGIDPGGFVVLGLRTSDMSKDEFSNLIELINAFAAERGVVFHEDVAA